MFSTTAIVSDYTRAFLQGGEGESRLTTALLDICANPRVSSVSEFW